jgi:hypothetical protein
MNSALTATVAKNDLGDTPNSTTPRPLSVAAAVGEADPKVATLEAAVAEWRASGVAEDIIAANVRVIHGEDVIEALNLAERMSDKSGGYLVSAGSKILSAMGSVFDYGGWIVSGLDPEDGYQSRMDWGKLKPVEPRQRPGGGIQKYEQPWGKPARATFLALPAQPDFWPSVEADPDKPIYICEGEKKAGCLLTLGYAAISVSGVWNATKKNSNGVHRLIPDLKRFAQKGRSVIFVFDKEGIPRKDATIYSAIKAAGQALQGEGVDARWVSWDSELGKGIDDVCARHGAEKVAEILAKQRRLKSHEETLFSVTKTVEQHVFEQFFESGRGGWAVINQGFYRDTGAGYWQHIDDAKMEKALSVYLMKCYRLLGKEKTPSYNVATDKAVVSAFKFARKALSAESDRAENSHLRCFTNGTLNTKTGELREHRKEDYLTSRIDSVFTPGRPCPVTFESFSASSFGAENLPLVRAVIAMMLDPSAPWGYFLYIVGQSGGGKGTLIRFIQSLFDKDNVRSGNTFSDISTPEGRHQYLRSTALYCFPDMGGYVQGVRAFYELVDNGALSGRPLYNSTTYHERFNTRFVVASVEPLAIENAGDGWERRAIVLPVVPGKRKKDATLEQRLSLCKSDVISWALSMDRDERDHLLLNSETASESAAEAKRSVTMTGDSVRQFIDLCLRPAPDGEGATLAQIHDWYRVFSKSFGYSDMGASKLGARIQSIIPGSYEPRRKIKSGEPGYEPNKFRCAQYNVIDMQGLFTVHQIAGLTIEKSLCVEGGLDAFCPVTEAEVAQALIGCQSWAHYCGVVERYGKDAVDKARSSLPAEVIQRIIDFQPDIAPPAPTPQTETTDPEPLKEHEVNGLADVLLAAVNTGGLEILEDFEQLPETHKRQVWGAIPEGQREAVRAAIKSPRQASIDNNEWEDV